MSKVSENYRALAAAVGLQYDGANDVLYGSKGDFEVMVYAADERYPYMLTIQTAAKGYGSAVLSREEKKEFKKSMKHVMALNQEGNRIMVSQKAIKKQEKLKAALTESISGLLSFLSAKGYTPCCSLCGQNAEAPAFRVGGGYMHLCQDCEGRMRKNLQNSSHEMEHGDENIIGGIVGALLGSLLGVLCIIVFSQMGYVAAASGVVMALGVLKGYELLGKKISKKSIVICMIIMLGMTYVGDRLQWALQFSIESGGNFFDNYRRVPQVMAAIDSNMRTYVYNLVLIYIFMLLGAVPIMRSKLRVDKEQARVVKIGSASDFIGNVSSFSSSER